MNPRPGQTRSFIYRICTVEGCGERHYSRGLCGLHWSPRRDPLNVPAAPPPPFPRRTIVADYCRTCGCPVCSWGCTGGERVHWHDRPVSATMDGKSEARAAQTVPGLLEQIGPAPMRHVTHTVNPSASQAT